MKYLGVHRSKQRLVFIVREWTVKSVVHTDFETDVSCGS